DRRGRQPRGAAAHRRALRHAVPNAVGRRREPAAADGGAGMSAEAANVVPLRPKRDDLTRHRDVEVLPAPPAIIQTPGSPTPRWTALPTATLFVLAILWACLGKLDIVAVAPGKIIPSSRVKVVQPFEIGVVRAILVKDGQAVKEGAPLLELDPTVADADSER